MSDLDRALEAAEVAAWGDFYRSCPPDLAARLGVRIVSLPGFVVTIAAAFDVLAFNRAIVTGLDVPPTSEALGALVGEFRKAGLPRAFVQIHPDLVDDELLDRLSAHGLAPYNGWIKLWRPVDSIPDVRSDLEVVEVGPENALEFAAVVVRSFGWPAGAEGMIASCVGRAGWQHYAAIDAGSIVATAASYVAGDCAWLDFAATLPAARGKGAQSALLERRISEARRAGCKRVVVETSEPRPDNVAQSLRNVTRVGFVSAYRRPNFLWTGP